MAEPARAPGSQARARIVPLLGLGLRSFSMNASAVPRVKQTIRAVEIDACARFARRVMEQSDPDQIEKLVAEFARHGTTDR